MGVASGSSECMLDNTHTGVINLVVAERASVAPSTRPDMSGMHTTDKLPPLAIPVDHLAFFVTIDVFR